MIGWVLVGDGGPGEMVEEGGGVSVATAIVTGIAVPLAKVGGARMIGVGVIMEGVLDGMGG